jgi:hypothetical protein
VIKMDKAQRGVLRSVVVQCRTILEESLRYVLEGDFGVDQEGHLEDESMLPHLDVDDLAARRVVVDHLSHFQAAGATPAQAVERAVREAAFTHLNRLCAYKMLERRKVIRETVSRGTDSDGFKFYLADRPKEELLWTSGKQDLAYRHFLTWRAESLSDQISVLFSPNEIANYLLPQHSAIESVLELINQSELEEIWDEDETIGWTYQYFTPDEVRRQARQESSAPRDSHELAFRNQFYTPPLHPPFRPSHTQVRSVMYLNSSSLKHRLTCISSIWNAHIGQTRQQLQDMLLRLVFCWYPKNWVSIR